MNMLMRRIFKSISVRLANEIDRYRRAEESLLSEWFDILYILLQSEEKKGNVGFKTWFQKEGESELTESPTPTESGQAPMASGQAGQPLYKVKILDLPITVKEHKKFRPQLSEVNLIPGIFPDSLPEIQSWRLDLVIYNETGKKVWPETFFSRYQYSQPQSFYKHEIRFSSGRELTAFEVKFVKSIFDTATEKLVSKK